MISWGTKVPDEKIPELIDLPCITLAIIEVWVRKTQVENSKAPQKSNLTEQIALMSMQSIGRRPPAGMRLIVSTGDESDKSATTALCNMCFVEMNCDLLRNGCL